jgi:hypothetical protein
MNATPPSDRIGEVVAAIERYLAQHPAACDSADGIHQRWIVGIEATVDDVSVALEHLTRMGCVQRARSGGRDVFRARHA